MNKESKSTELMALLVTRLKELGNVSIRPISDKKIEVFDKRGAGDTADFSFSFSDEDSEVVDLVIDIGVADAWLTSAVTLIALSICSLNLKDPALCHPLDKKTYTGEAAYSKLFDMGNELEEALNSQIEYQLQEDEMRDEIGEYLDEVGGSGSEYLDKQAKTNKNGKKNVH